MVEVNIIEEIEKILHSTTEKKCTFTDFTKVWKSAANIILNCLQQNKCVILKNLGTFSLERWTLDAGIRREIIHFQSVFILSKDLLQCFNLHQSKTFADDRVPVTPLNYCEITKETNINHHIIHYCLQTITQNLWKFLQWNRDVILEFPNLGVLTIRNHKVNFDFYVNISPMKMKSQKICYKAKAAGSEYYPKNVVPCKFHSLK